jgi:hypothetical protein
MQRQPSQKTEDIGARLDVPSEFSVLLRITGVPMYRMDGSTQMLSTAIVCSVLSVSAFSSGKRSARVEREVLAEDLTRRRKKSRSYQRSADVNPLAPGAAEIHATVIPDQHHIGKVGVLVRAGQCCARWRQNAAVSCRLI